MKLEFFKVTYNLMREMPKINVLRLSRVWLICSLIIFCGFTFTKFSPFSNYQHEKEDEIKDNKLISQTMHNREVHLLESCAEKGYNYTYLSESKNLLSHLLLDQKYKIIYCYIPKVACTNWKRILLLMNENSKYTNLMDIPADSVHRKGVFIKLSDMKPNDIKIALTTWKKFLIVRDPMERLVSAYRNKFELESRSSRYFKKRIGIKILEKYRPNQVIPESGDGVKFSEFIQYIIDLSAENMSLLNEHWAPYDQLCLPCSVRYNMIGKYESLANDSDYILRNIEVPDKIQFPTVKQSKTTGVVNSYLEKLTKNQLNELYRLYEPDFKYFQYKFN